MDKDLAELICTLTLFSTQHSQIKMLSNYCRRKLQEISKSTDYSPKYV